MWLSESLNRKPDAYDVAAFTNTKQVGITALLLMEIGLKPDEVWVFPPYDSVMQMQTYVYMCVSEGKS